MSQAGLHSVARGKYKRRREHKPVFAPPGHTPLPWVPLPDDYREAFAPPKSPDDLTDALTLADYARASAVGWAPIPKKRPALDRFSREIWGDWGHAPDMTTIEVSLRVGDKCEHFSLGVMSPTPALSLSSKREVEERVIDETRKRLRSMLGGGDELHSDGTPRHTGRPDCLCRRCIRDAESGWMPHRGRRDPVPGGYGESLFAASMRLGVTSEDMRRTLDPRRESPIYSDTAYGEITGEYLRKALDSWGAPPRKKKPPKPPPPTTPSMKPPAPGLRCTVCGHDAHEPDTAACVVCSGAVREWGGAAWVEAATSLGSHAE